MGDSLSPFLIGTGASSLDEIIHDVEGAATGNDISGFQCGVYLSAVAGFLWTARSDT